jgi:type I restriction enzyme S subunit
MKVPSGWKWSSLDHVVEINRASLAENCSEEQEFFYIDLGSVDSGQVAFPGERIKLRDAPSRARRLFERGDVLMATVRPLLGGFAYVDFRPDDYVCSTGFAVLHPMKGTVGQFIFQTLFSPWFRKQYAALTAGSNYPALNASEVGELELLLPPEGEQAEIAEILHCWDGAIRLLDGLLLAKGERKRGLMQQLLTGKLRFKEFEGERWRSLALRDILTFEPRVVTKPKGAFLAAGIRSHGKGVFLKPDFEADDIALDELFQLHSGDLVVNITFAWEGAVAIVPPEADGALVSHRFPTFTFRRGVSAPGYFRHVIRQKRFVHELGLVSPGGAGRNRVLSKSDFLRIRVELPSFEEQQRIAAVLNASDREIEALQKQLDALREQKRGLMQRLLTGEKRVELRGCSGENK